MRKISAQRLLLISIRKHFLPLYYICGSRVPQIERSKTEESGYQVMGTSIISVFANLVGYQTIWGVLRQSRVLTPSPRDSDIDLLEMDSDRDPLFMPSRTCPNPKIIWSSWGHHVL